MTAPGTSRLAVVLSHPTQYYSPWFRWLQSHADLTLRVFYLWEAGVTKQHDPHFQTTFKWDVDLLSGYDWEFVPNAARTPGTEHFWGLRNPHLTHRLSLWRPDAVLLFGYAYASHLRVILWARWHGVPLIFRGDSHFLGRPAPGAWRIRLLRLLYRQFSAVTYVGQANRDYFITLGVPAARLFFAPHSVNHLLFTPGDLSNQAAAALRRELGIAPTTKVVLFAGKFIAAKQPRELLGAFLALNRADTTLVLVGDGPEAAGLREAARAAPPGRIHFLPFANQSEMPVRFAMADLFVLPSRGLYETWGLAVNEAMLLGVPCLVSDRVGCQRDLVTPGETGWVFRAQDLPDLREKLGAALDADLSAMKPRIAARIAGYSYVETTAGLLSALRHVLGSSAAT